MYARALYRILGIFLLTWSVVEQPVSGNPIVMPQPKPVETKPTENITELHTTVKPNVTLSPEANTANSLGFDDKRMSNHTSSSNDSTVTSKPEIVKSALSTNLPTSDYAELTNIENMTKSFIAYTSNESTTNAVLTIKNNTTNPETSSTVKWYMGNESTTLESTTTVRNIFAEKKNEDKSKSSFEIEKTTENSETKKEDPDIVSVFDNVANYDSLLPSFMNTSTSMKSTEQYEEVKNYTNKSAETSFANISSPSWKKYSTIDRKRTTKSSGDITNTTESPTTVSEITTTEKAKIKNYTHPSQNLDKTTKSNATEETLTGIASTWNRTTYLPRTNVTDAKRSKENVTKSMATTTDRSQATIDAAESGILASKRSGFIDNSKSSDAVFITSTTETTTHTETETETESFSFENFKSNSTAVSKQRIVEDALNEERLKEWSLNAMNDVVTQNKVIDTTGTESTTDGITTTENQNITISKHNSSINPLLYKVNSNYKPLKKLEVQPHKPFTIDPDDNSWRNESINSRGIVYKPKNSSKPFTQVLKNKTESEWHNLLEKEFKDDEIELKDRLGKIAALRKNKKKLTGSVTSDETFAASSTEMLLQGDNIKSTTPYLPVFNQILFTTSSPLDKLPSTPDVIERLQNDSNTMLTEKPIEHLNNADAYDSYDEDEKFVTVTEFDSLKTSQTTPKIRTPSYPQKAFTKTETTTSFPHYTTHYPPNRKGTIEYFPPKTTKVSFNDYDLRFKEKVNTFTTDFLKNRIEPLTTILTTTERFPKPEKKVVEPSVYMMPPYETRVGDVEDSGYVIKHYKDFVSKAAGESNSATPRTPSFNLDRAFMTSRSPIVQKFIESFNRNADKLKEEFPILYKTNIVHSGGDDGRIVASSSAYLRRLYSPEQAPRHTTDNIFLNTKKYDPSCANHSVELSPAYELHYFVNDEEQKQPGNIDPAAPYNDFA